VRHVSRPQYKGCTTDVSDSVDRVLTDLIDRVLVNRVLGMPIFLGTMCAVFLFTFTVAERPMKWIEAGFGWLGEVVSGLWTPGSDSILQSLIVDGIVYQTGTLLNLGS
jgi:ferrous iron transport protein B